MSRLILRAGSARLAVSGVSITDGVSGKEVVDAATLDDPLCQRALPNTIAGKIVLCQRGVNARVEKSANVKAGGGAGMVLYNTVQRDVETDNHWVPTIHVNDTVGAQVIAFTTAHSNTTILGDFTPGQARTRSKGRPIRSGVTISPRPVHQAAGPKKKNVTSLPSSAPSRPSR